MILWIFRDSISEIFVAVAYYLLRGSSIAYHFVNIEISKLFYSVCVLCGIVTVVKRHRRLCKHWN